jgi:hypothetical protein
MIRWWTAALLVSSLVLGCGCGCGGPAAAYEGAVRDALETKPSSLKLRWEKDGPPGKRETVVHAVLEYDDAGDLGCRGYRFEVKHNIDWPKGTTHFEVSGPDGGEVFVMEFEQGDRMLRLVDQRAKHKVNALKKRCKEIRTALVKVLGPGASK